MWCGATKEGDQGRYYHRCAKAIGHTDECVCSCCGYKWVDKKESVLDVKTK